MNKVLKHQHSQWQDDIKSWRRDIHQHPELGFNEHRTSDLVAEKLRSFGLDVHRGLAGTGVVGTLKVGTSSRAIGLRADMDALPMQEKNTFAHCSVHPNTMHACGHDGHTAMLLGAARYLAASKQFDGTLQFIFQPAEESLGGARVMMEEGLFTRFPVDAVYGMHNWPGMPVGQFGIRPGAMMASLDTFDITIKGKGGHAAMPHDAVDPVVIAGQLIGLLQTIVSRNVRPIDAAVISVTQLDAGSAYNVIPGQAVLRGSLRALNTEVQNLLKKRIAEVVNSLCSAFGASAAINYPYSCPVLWNANTETEVSVAVARNLVGDENIDTVYPPTMGSEDFAFMLHEKPGSYIFIGNGGGDQAGACMLHNPAYDFNDDAIGWGVAYWCQLAEAVLPVD